MLSPDKTFRKDTMTALPYPQMRLRGLWIRIIYAYEKTIHRNCALFVVVIVVVFYIMAIYIQWTHHT